MWSHCVGLFFNELNILWQDGAYTDISRDYKVVYQDTDAFLKQLLTRNRKKKKSKTDEEDWIKKFLFNNISEKKNIWNNNLVKNEIMRRSKLQSQVLSLYKQCLRAAESKPGFKVIKKPAMLCGVTRGSASGMPWPKQSQLFTLHSSDSYKKVVQSIFSNVLDLKHLLSTLP